MEKYTIGIDLGGTFIKGGVVDANGKVLAYDKAKTGGECGAKAVTENIAAVVADLLKTTGLDKDSIVGIGMGAPGMIDSKKGEVVYSNNLRWAHFPIAAELTALTGLPVKIANDANVAALGEAKFGAAKGCEDVVMITLGTGVGGGVVVGGKIMEGNKSAGAELGHVVIEGDGKQCTCGRRGCLEAYASATALIRDTKEKMLEHPDSKMWEIGSIDDVDGKTAFAYREKDVYAKEVVEEYIRQLGFGIVNFANIFRPEKILLGGGVCAEGDNLIKPLQAIMDRDLFGGDQGPAVPICVASLGNSAGILGAAALWM
ncbi:MAG: ROK family protein [Clostridia bacterium]|nr:ROK family protein [Clostridia bacterium]